MGDSPPPLFLIDYPDSERACFRSYDLDRDTIISWAVLIIVALLALNYLHFDCNVSEEQKPVKGFMEFEKSGSYQTQPGDAPQHQCVETEYPEPGEGSGDRPVPGPPVPGPGPGGPPGP